MQWNPYLAFDNQCREAFEFYEKCLGVKIVAMIGYGDTPAKEHMPASTGARIMHARLVLGDQILMGCDAHPEMPYDGIRGCDVAVQVGTPALAPISAVPGARSAGLRRACSRRGSAAWACRPAGSGGPGRCRPRP